MEEQIQTKDRSSRKKRIVFSAVAIVLILSLVLAFLFLFPEKEKGQFVSSPSVSPTQTVEESSDDTDPVSESVAEVETEAEELTASATDEALPLTEEKKDGKEPMAQGIDVSKWQGNIDWNEVKASGVDFAMIRLGSPDGQGELALDPNAVYNLQQAERAGVLTGVYVYSDARTPMEAKEEAQWVLSQIGGFAISYPVVLDFELGGRESTVSAAVRTDTALSFLRTVQRGGYEGMLYAPMSEFEDPAVWEASRLLGEFPVWIARYSDVAYPEISYPETQYDYAMWQYTEKGRVPGIQGNVDRNVAYFSRSFTPAKNETERPEEIYEEEEFENQTFERLSLSLTAKEVVNLRATPSIEGEIVGELKKGEVLLCTGKSNLGWARLQYNGQNVYAVFSYLTEVI